MTYEFKCKVIDGWFSRNQTEWDVFGIKYNACPISWFGSTKRILVDELIHLITENKFRKK